MRLSGPAATTVAVAAGLDLPRPWSVSTRTWDLGCGQAPCRVLFLPAGRSATGHDTVEVVLPGARDLVDLALNRWQQAGAVAAGPGDFTRQAWRNGQLDLDQAEALLALFQAQDAQAAGLALTRLQSGLRADLEPVRQRLLELRALIEAGLDFLDEEDVVPLAPDRLAAELQTLIAVVNRFRRAASALAPDPLVVLCGPVNAGKSALFHRLTGIPALVSPCAGTTRDWLEAPLRVGGRTVRLIDTAGWSDGPSDHLDQAAQERSRALLAQAGLILVCQPADGPAPSPACADLPADRTVVIATKADLGLQPSAAVLAVSAITGSGLAALLGLIGDRLSGCPAGDARIQARLEEAATALARVAARPRPDELAAADLSQAAEALGSLWGDSTPDEILDRIFARFCIGK